MSIFDDLVQGISREVSKVQARSQEMLDTFNLTQQVRDLERKKVAKLLEIGRLIVDKYHHNAEVAEDKLKEKVQEVVGYEEQITLLQGEMDQVKAANDPDAPASRKSEAKAGYKTTPGAECPRCTAPVNKDKAFCPVCGESLSDGSKSKSGTASDNGGTGNY